MRGGSLSLSHGGARRARPTLVATGPPGIGAGRYGNDPVALRFRARQLDYTTARFKIASAAICRVRRPAEALLRPTVRRLGCGTPARRGGGASPTTYRGMCRARGAGRRAKTRGCGTTRPKKGEGRAAELDQGGHARPRSGPKPGGTLLGAAACSGRDPDGVLVYAERVAGRARRPSQRASTVAPTEAAGLEGRDEAGRAVQVEEGRSGVKKAIASG